MAERTQQVTIGRSTSTVTTTVKKGTSDTKRRGRGAWSPRGPVALRVNPGATRVQPPNRLVVASVVGITGLATRERPAQTWETDCRPATSA